MGYIMDLRAIVGSRPLIMAGACVILLDDKGQLLLQLRKDNHCWGLAGGSLEPGEALEEVAKRELYEETGLIAKKLVLFDVFSGKGLYYKYPHGDEVYNVVTAYVCTDYRGDLVVQEEEVQEIAFFSFEHLPANISPPDIPVIQRFVEKYYPVLSATIEE